MSKRLGIKGHPTRGKEVIELLEMIGGENCYNFSGFNDYAYYVIEGCQNKIRAGEYIFGDEDIYFFTLEEFLEKYPFKIGDKVHIYVQNDDIDGRYDIEVAEIDSMRWNPVRCKIAYKMKNINREFYKEEIKYKVDDNHAKPSKMKNVLTELLEHIKTTPKEELEREFNELEEWSNVGPTVEEFMDFCNKVNKKPKYLKTYEECKALLYLQDTIVESRSGYRWRLVSNFQKLLLCRDAYWKIAGEEMGLGKPWDSTYGCGEWGYWIGYSINEKKIYLQDSRILVNHTLVFPTKEMRDTFYENFKDLIEQCKTLL